MTDDVVENERLHKKVATLERELGGVQAYADNAAMQLAAAHKLLERWLGWYVNIHNGHRDNGYANPKAGLLNETMAALGITELGSMQAPAGVSDGN